MEFPALVYRSASSYLQVKDETEYWAALRDGWFATVPEALAPQAVIERETMEELQKFAREARAGLGQMPSMRIASITPIDATEAIPPAIVPAKTGPVTRRELEAVAEALGIVVDGRWGDAKLTKKIAEAQGIDIAKAQAK